MELRGLPKRGFELGTARPVWPSFTDISYQHDWLGDPVRVHFAQTLEWRDNTYHNTFERYLGLDNPRDLAVMEAEARMLAVDIGGRDGAPVRLDILAEAYNDREFYALHARNAEGESLVILVDWGWGYGVDAVTPFDRKPRQRQR